MMRGYIISVKKVKALPDYQLQLTFENGEEKLFDMREYLNIGIFQELKDEILFNNVRVSYDTIEWDNGADLDSEILYNHSIAVQESA